MPAAYCGKCRNQVNATPSGPSVLGAVKVEREEGADVYLPILNVWRPHYCPGCGSPVTLKSQDYSEDEYETARTVMNVLCPIGLLVAIAIAAQADDNIYKIFFGAVGVGGVLFLWWIFGGKRRK